MLWYPDDSGEWIEHTSGVAPDLPRNTEMKALLRYQRENKEQPDEAQWILDWDWSIENVSGDIVAYKVTK